MKEARTRAFYCRRCGTEETSVTVPAHWYSLGRYATDLIPDGRRRLVGLGLYCQLSCLIEQLAEMQPHPNGAKP
jgi:hypothetical protein